MELLPEGLEDDFENEEDKVFLPMRVRCLEVEETQASDMQVVDVLDVNVEEEAGEEACPAKPSQVDGKASKNHNTKTAASGSGTVETPMANNGGPTSVRNLSVTVVGQPKTSADITTRSETKNATTTTTRNNKLRVPNWRQEVQCVVPTVEAVLSCGCSQTLQPTQLDYSKTKAADRDVQLFYHPEIEAVYPSEYPVPPHIEQFCFPDNGCTVKFSPTLATRPGSQPPASAFCSGIGSPIEFSFQLPITPDIAAVAGIQHAAELDCAFQTRKLHAFCFSWDRISYVCHF